MPATLKNSPIQPPHSFGIQRYFPLRRALLAFGLTLVAVNIAMAAVGAARHPAFFGEPGALRSAVN